MDIYIAYGRKGEVTKTRRERDFDRKQQRHASVTGLRVASREIPNKRNTQEMIEDMNKTKTSV
jgi:hypothetical protein